MCVCVGNVEHTAALFCCVDGFQHAECDGSSEFGQPFGNDKAPQIANWNEYVTLSDPTVLADNVPLYIRTFSIQRSIAAFIYRTIISFKPEKPQFSNFAICPFEFSPYFAPKFGEKKFAREGSDLMKDANSERRANAQQPFASVCLYRGYFSSSQE